MAEEDGAASAAADNDGGLGGDKKDTPAQKKQVKNEHILIAVGLITLIVTIIYLRKQAANASSSTTATAADPYGYGSPGGYGGGGGASQSQYTNQQLASLAADMQDMQSEIVGLTTTVSSTGAAQQTQPASSGATTPVSGTTLPPVNQAAWQNLYQFGQYSDTEFTKIGSEAAQGRYSGMQVSGGVPVFASNGFGGLQQGVSPFAASTPAGTDFYIPSEYAGYEHS